MTYLNLFYILKWFWNPMQSKVVRRDINEGEAARANIIYLY